MNPSSIRPATNEDRVAIEHLVFGVLAEYGLQPDPAGTDSDLADIEAIYQHAGGCFDVLLDAAGQIIGTVGLFPVSPGVCELRKMYLASAARGQGQGRRLLEHALAEAAARGFFRVTLETASVLKEAIALYERYGFHRCAPGHLAARCDSAYELDFDILVRIRQATVRDTEEVAGVLCEAAEWLQQRNMPMWRADELSADRIASDVAAGEFFVAECKDKIVGTVKFQLSDQLFWPDSPVEEAAYIHRLAVRRDFAGGRVSGELLRWAGERARTHGRQFLRLDCEASRAALRAVYERLGFRFHSERQVGPYFVARYEQRL